MSGPVVVIGDTLLDRDVHGEATRLAPDAPVPVVDVGAERARAGGAALAAALAARAGRDTVLVTALGQGPASDAARAHLAGRVRLVELPLDGDVPVKTRIMAHGRCLVRMDHAGGTPRELDEAMLDTVATLLEQAGAVLVADYGRRTADVLRPLLPTAAAHVPLVWDPHPRGGAPEPGARLVTPNASEARVAAGVADATLRDAGDTLAAHTRRASVLADRWRAAGVAVTLGERGALLSRGTDSPILVPAPYAASGDPCGAGDCFAAAAMVALADHALPEEAVRHAVTAATDFVARGGVGDPELEAGQPGAPRFPADDPPRLARSVRSRGGTVVATGGCFDLLHAGHVGLLQSARRLGDCLIVCLNSDASVRRLKGAGRPFNTVRDRARVLLGLDCVDAVAVFDESTPIALLERLRPHLWIKGGDYTAESLPETAALRRWGGQALVLPYLDGLSTTTLARRAAASFDAATGYTAGPPSAGLR